MDSWLVRPQPDGAIPGPEGIPGGTRLLDVIPGCLELSGVGHSVVRFSIHHAEQIHSEHRTYTPTQRINYIAFRP